MNRLSQSRRRSAFTLIELLVVILILAILAALIVPRVVGRTDDAKRAKAASDIASLGKALSQFRLDCGRYPTAEEGLEALLAQPGEVTGWRGPYIERAVPPDPWGNPYVYEFPGRTEDSYLLVSYGQDGAPGGEGNNADVGDDLGEY